MSTSSTPEDSAYADGGESPMHSVFIVQQMHKFTRTERMVEVLLDKRAVRSTRKGKPPKTYSARSFVNIEMVSGGGIVVRIQEKNKKQPKKYMFDTSQNRDRFVNLVRGLQRNRAPPRAWFDLFDVDGDGKISLSDLEQTLTTGFSSEAADAGDESTDSRSAKSSSATSHASTGTESAAAPTAAAALAKRARCGQSPDVAARILLEWCKMSSDREVWEGLDYYEFIRRFICIAREYSAENFLLTWGELALSTSDDVIQQRTSTSNFGVQHFLPGEQSWNETSHVSWVLQTENMGLTTIRGTLLATNYRLIFTAYRELTNDNEDRMGGRRSGSSGGGQDSEGLEGTGGGEEKSRVDESEDAASTATTADTASALTRSSLHDNTVMRIGSLRSQNIRTVPRRRSSMIVRDRVKADKYQKSMSRARLMFVDRIMQVPLLTVRDITQSKRGGSIRLICKDFREIKFAFDASPKWVKGFVQMLSSYIFPTNFEAEHKYFAALYHHSKNIDTRVGSVNGWFLYIAEQEFQRLGVLPKAPTLGPDAGTESRKRRSIMLSQKFRLFDNSEYAVSPTYPAFFVVPAIMTNADVQRVAKYRSAARLPVLTWRHPSGECIMCRSSQPMSGVKNKREPADEKLINLYRTCGVLEDEADRMNSTRKGFYILDARSWTAATANKVVRGKGAENKGHYGVNTGMEFCDIPNIHTMRNSQRSLEKLVEPDQVSDSDTNFLSLLEETSWLKHIQSVLKASLRLVEMMDREHCSVLIHCSDGWDRTAQIGAAAQIMMDPYYRTLEGLCVLIEKEWCSFGHKFRDRLGHGASGKADKERSPIFLQWVDAVWQIMRQFPTAFEYNENVLITIADEAYSCRFGTFLDNCERERMERNRIENTTSLWTYILDPSNRPMFCRSAYEPNASVLWVCANPRRVVLWEAYYLRWDPSLWPVAVINGYDETLMYKQEGGPSEEILQDDAIELAGAEETSDAVIEVEEYEGFEFEAVSTYTGLEPDSASMKGSSQKQLSADSANRLVL
eukprot:g1115.t1